MVKQKTIRMEVTPDEEELIAAKKILQDVFRWLYAQRPFDIMVDMPKK